MVANNSCDGVGDVGTSIFVLCYDTEPTQNCVFD